MSKQFYNAKDVQELLQVKETYSYKIIKELNKELQAKGFLTITGKVPSKYLHERYGIALIDDVA